jgi:SPP1 gp7 family putative phage head morphogenesis protein
MLELNFEVFWEHYEKQNRLKNEDWRKLHYLEEPKGFTLYLKSAEYWEYKTFIPMSKILEFGAEYGTDEAQAIKDFKTNFLHEAMPLKLKEVEVENAPVEIAKEITKIDDYQAKDYADFLEHKFKQWEKAILRFVDDTLKDEVIEKNIEKSFGEFIRGLFNVVNTSGFMTQLKAVVGVTLKKGITEAEQELNVDIGVGLDFDQKVKQQADRQIEGFNINGKEWHGIKGVAKDVQNEIRESIAKSINDKESLTTVKSNVKDIMGKYTGTEIKESRAMRIARTETNRMQNASKLDSYKRSGIVEYKKWDAFFDNRTSDICKRMHKQEQLLDAPFVDPKDGKQYMQPPDTHPNCRCVLRSVLKE